MTWNTCGWFYQLTSSGLEEFFSKLVLLKEGKLTIKYFEWIDNWFFFFYVFYWNWHSNLLQVISGSLFYLLLLFKMVEIDDIEVKNQKHNSIIK